MANMVERYIHQVGQYLPQKERAEIEAELRSQINDQLEDRYGDKATPEQVAAVLVELGHPRRMAASYSGDQYLIGPVLYPFMMMVLRRGWMIIPVVVVIVHAVLALFAESPVSLINLFLDMAGGVVQALLMFSAIVVLIFALIERSGEDIDELTGQEKAFNPADLPDVGQPGGVDRIEAIFGIAFGAFWVFVLLYFLRVGGLTMFFNLGDAATMTVIPVPIPWLILLILNVVAQIALSAIALWRNRWTLGTLLAQTALELFGAVAFYFVILLPLFNWAIGVWPGLSSVPFVDRAPDVFLAVSLLIALAGGVIKIFKFLTYRQPAAAI